jgi:hypothetical protein
VLIGIVESLGGLLIDPSYKTVIVLALYLAPLPAGAAGSKLSTERGGRRAMGKFIAAIVAGVLATVIGGLILNAMTKQGRRPWRGDVSGITHLAASLHLEHAGPRGSRP